MAVAKTLAYFKEPAIPRQSGCPGDVAFGKGVELVVIRSGDVVSLLPCRNLHPRDDCAFGGVASPPSIEERDDEELPERAGL